MLPGSSFCFRFRCMVASSWCRVSLLYYSKFVVHLLELKVWKKCRCHLAWLVHVVTKCHTLPLLSALPMLHINDCVLLPNYPSRLYIFVMRHTCPWHWKVSLSENTEYCLLIAILGSKHMSVTRHTLHTRIIYYNSHLPKFRCVIHFMFVCFLAKFTLLPWWVWGGGRGGRRVCVHVWVWPQDRKVA